MRHRSALRVTSPVAASGVCRLLALLPSLWVSWQAPIARGVILPTLAILTLVLLLPQSADDRVPARDERRETSGRRSSSSFFCRLLALFAWLARQIAAIATYPALLYLGWAAICAARASGALGGVPPDFVGHPAALRAMPGAADFARGELLRLTAGVAVYLVVATTARHWERARQLVDALLWAVIGATGMAFVTHSAEDAALIGPFGNPQLLAAVLLLLVPLAIVVGTAARDRRRRILAQVATVLALAALAFAQARSAWIGSFVAVLTLALLLPRLPKRHRRRWSHRSPFLRPADGVFAGGPPLAAGMLALAVLAWLVCHSDLTGPVSSRAATLSRLSDDEGAAWRVRQWRVALSLARDHPWAGGGLGSYPLAAAPRLPQPIPVAVARSVGPNLSLNAHSYYLQSLAETGVIGLGLYLWALAGFFIAGLRACRRREHPFRSLVLVACMAAVAGQAIDALANPAYQFAEVSLFFWAILGLGTAMAQSPPRRSPLPQSEEGSVEATPGEERHAERVATEPLTVSPLAEAPTPHGGGARLRRGQGRGARGRSPGQPKRGENPGSHSLLPLPYPLRLAAVFTGAGVLIAGTVAGSPPPLNQAEYMPLRTFRVVALTTPGYLLQTLLPGECVEMRGIGTLYSDEEQDATAECSFTRAGGTAPADCLEQLPAPNANLFCVRTSVPAECDGQTVSVQGTFSFNGQTLTALGPPLCLSVPRAAAGTLVTATPRVIPPSGEMVEIRVQYAEGGLRFQRLLRVDANEPLAPDDVRIVDDTHVMLRATSTVPDRRIYTLRYRFRDHHNRTWMAPVQVYVR